MSCSAARSASVTTSTGLDFVSATSTPALRRSRTRLAASSATVRARSSSSVSVASAAGSVLATERRPRSPGVRAAPTRAHVPGRLEAAHRGPDGVLAALHRRALEEQVAGHGDEPGVQAGGGRPDEAQPELLRGGLRLRVEVVDD